MGIFSRFTDIISANINAMLDKAEDPEKMIKLMIREMEETLVELKASCAGSMADRKRVGREMEEVQSRVATWLERAKLAVDKGREDLAREAILEKHRWQRREEALREEQARFDALVGQSQEDIALLEDKLNAAKEKQRLLVQRHIRASTKKRAHEDLRRAAGADAILRFEQYERRIEHMEAEADLVAPATAKRGGIEDEFALLEGDEEILSELEALKAEAAKTREA